MIEVFRIEHKDSHIGPFQTYDPYTQALAEKASNQPHLKLPGDDGLGLDKISWTYVFGSNCLQKLKQWFLFADSEEQNQAVLAELEARNFVLAEYLIEAEDCIVSDSGIQVAFCPSNAREEGLVQYHPLSALA